MKFIVQKLLNSSIRLNIEEDALAWSKSSINVKYTASLGYLAIFLAGSQEDVCWWCKPIWKLKALMKAGLQFPIRSSHGKFCGNAHGKTLVMARHGGETIYHLFI